jgi:hypothetical protein
MWPGVPSASDERRIIPIRPDASSPGSSPRPPSPSPARPSRAVSVVRPDDAVRHYLKFTLPSIPVATFVLAFVLCYLLLGLDATSRSDVTAGRPVDPTLPFLAALLLALTTGLLSVWIYRGYRRLRERETVNAPPLTDQ